MQPFNNSVFFPRFRCIPTKHFSHHSRLYPFRLLCKSINNFNWVITGLLQSFSKLFTPWKDDSLSLSPFLFISSFGFVSSLVWLRAIWKTGSVEIWQIFESKIFWRNEIISNEKFTYFCFTSKKSLMAQLCEEVSYWNYFYFDNLSTVTFATCFFPRVRSIFINHRWIF